MWKPNASRLSYNLVVILLFLSLMKSRSRKEATEVDSVVSEIVSSLGHGVNIRNELPKVVDSCQSFCKVPL